MPSFKTWLFMVDQYLVQNLGLDSGSMEDWNWRDAYNAGEIPAQAAQEFIEEVRSS